MRLREGYHHFDRLSRSRQRLLNLPEKQRTTQRWKNVGPALSGQAKKNTLYIAVIGDTPDWIKAEYSTILTEIFRSYTQSST